jgi:hypothetical protein
VAEQLVASQEGLSSVSEEKDESLFHIIYNNRAVSIFVGSLGLYHDGNTLD